MTHIIVAPMTMKKWKNNPKKSSKLSSHDEDIDHLVFEDDNLTGQGPCVWLRHAV